MNIQSFHQIWTQKLKYDLTQPLRQEQVDKKTLVLKRNKDGGNLGFSFS